MRALPSATFRDELKAYQQQLSALPPLNEPWKGQLAQEVVARWIDHTECESIWTTVWPLMKVQVTPGHFIREIILARNDTERLNIIVREAPTVEAKARARTRRLFREKKYTQLGYENEVLGDFVERRASVLGREKTGPRLTFMKRLSGGFVRWCGQPLDNVVRVLTEIAFGEPITTEAVRAARSSRPKRDRGTRPAKKGFSAP
jgi:hypothetical protein